MRDDTRLISLARPPIADDPFDQHPSTRRMSPVSSEFLFRVRRSYRLALELSPAPTGRIWSKINRMRADVHDALLADSDEPLREIFTAPDRTDLFYGADNTAKSIAKGPTGNRTRDLENDFALLDGIVNRVDESDPEKALTRLDAKLRQTITFPSISDDEAGIITSRGVASYRALQAIYQAWRVLELTNGNANSAILEIGPGLGRAIFYCYRAGLTDLTTVDLPLGVVAQAYFLGRGLGPERIWLLGDDPQLAAGRIKLLPAGYRLGRFDLVVNVDSLVEMPLITQIEYLRLIAKSGALLLSINHSIGGFSVEKVVRTFLPCSEVKTKPYPMRKGYAESCFKLAMPAEITLAFRLRYIFTRCVASVQYRTRNILKSCFVKH